MRSSTRLILFSAACLLAFGLAGCQTEEGPAWPAFGRYRTPYATGTEFRVTNDFTTHDPNGKFDLAALGGGEATVVAAADGWIRYLQDSNSESTPGHTHNNYIWIEHPYPFCQPDGVTWPGKPADYDETCIPCLDTCWNEWSKYSHLVTDSATTAGLEAGMWVTAGTFLGFEGDVGHGSGTHLHWEVAKLDPSQPFKDPDGPDRPDVPTDDAWPYDWSEGGWVGSPGLLPTICGHGVMMEGQVLTAEPCD